jgi:hypothetical protein
MLAGLEVGIETAAPFPLIHVDGAAGAACDHADANVAIEDAPTGGLWIIDLAAGEDGHAPMIPQIDGARKLSILWGAERRQTTALCGSRAQARHCLRYFHGRKIQARGRFSFAATEPRNYEYSSEDNDQDDAHDKSAADEAAVPAATRSSSIGRAFQRSVT